LIFLEQNLCFRAVWANKRCTRRTGGCGTTRREIVKLDCRH